MKQANITVEGTKSSFNTDYEPSVC